MKSQSEIARKRRMRERNLFISRIKDVAREMFIRDGYEAVTLHKIASALEYTRPAIYRYFKNKDELLTAIVLEDMADLHSRLVECAHIEEPLERLIEMARRESAWAVEHPNHYLLFHSRAWMMHEDHIRAEWAIPQEQEPLHLLFDSVREIIMQGRVKDEYQDAVLLTKTLVAAVHGIIMLEINISNYDRKLMHDRDYPLRERVDTLIHGFMRGVLR